MTIIAPAPPRPETRPLPPPRLAERALAVSDSRYEALWAAVQVYRRLLEEAE